MLNADSSVCNTLNSTSSPQFSATALLHKAKLTGAASNNGNIGIGNSVHHDPSRALGDLIGIKKHFCRKHNEKKYI